MAVDEEINSQGMIIYKHGHNEEELFTNAAPEEVHKHDPITHKTV